jgi:probable phosphoglycerate mutase
MELAMNEHSVYLVRHGVLVIDDVQRYVGQADLLLSEEGLNQAHALQRSLQHIEFTQIYCSDLIRACQTAEIIAAGRRIRPTSCRSFREICLGQWEGCSQEEIAKKFPLEFKARGEDIESYRPPGGESFADCAKRVLPAFRKIVNSGPGDVLLVGHSGVNRLILCDVLGIPISNLFRIGQEYGCLNLIQFPSSRPRLELLNFVPWHVPCETSFAADSFRAPAGR